MDEPLSGREGYEPACLLKRGFAGSRKAWHTGLAVPIDELDQTIILCFMFLAATRIDGS
jgi:hypothetical protein